MSDRAKFRFTSLAIALCISIIGANSAFAMVLYVYAPTQNYTLDVEPSDTIENVKQKIQDQIRVADPSTMVLTYAGLTLQNGRTLSDYNIQRQAIFHLTFQSAASVSIPDPVQQSKIVGISPEKVVAIDSVTVVTKGTFVEDVRSIQVNGVALSVGSWKQTATTLTFTVTPSFSGVYSIQIYNGSAPVLAAQTLSVSAAPGAPKPASLTRSRYIYLRCTTASKKRIVYGTNPSCPVGYAKQ